MLQVNFITRNIAYLVVYSSTSKYLPKSQEFYIFIECPLSTSS